MKCSLCGPVSHHEADFEVSFGPFDRILRLCQYCQQDLTLLGFRSNQLVRLEASKAKGSVISICEDCISAFSKARRAAEQ